MNHTPVCPTDAINSLPLNSLAVLCTAPVNIAVVKYWGKRDIKLILPVNSSLSGTLDSNTMASTTCIISSSTYTKDEIVLNGHHEQWSDRLLAVLNGLKKLITKPATDESGNIILTIDELRTNHIHIISSNNFPTAAGLASSASGFACLSYAIAQLYNIQDSFPGELSTYARQGSGSACRSLYSGWVSWEKGMNFDGTDSIAVQIADHHHWPDMRVLILVANNKRKETASTDGMQRTVQTSQLLKYRAEHIVPKRMNDMIHSIKMRNFHVFAELTIKDSNSFHATCLDTYPPIFYLNHTSQQIIRIIDIFNSQYSTLQAAYTYDAGPNAVVYYLDKHTNTLMTIFQQYFGTSTPLHDPLKLQQSSQSTIDHNIVNAVINKLQQRDDTISISQIILTQIGDGPQLIKRTNTINK